MKKISFLFLTGSILFSFPHLILAQSTGMSGPSVSATDQAADVDQTSVGLFDPISTRIISDPLYLPLKGQIYGATAYSFSRPTSNGYNFDGVKTSSIHGDDNTFSQTLNYGLTDDFTLRLVDSYADDRSYSTLTSTNTSTRTDDRGFTDPEIGATYRVLDQVRYPVDFDLTADYLPNAFSDKSGNDGTVASGRQEGILEAALGREMKAFTVQAYTEAIYLGDRNIEAESNGDEYNEKEAWDYAFGLNTQTRLTDRFSINLGAGYQTNNNQNATNTTSGLSWIAVPANVWSYNTALNYQIIPDRLVASLTYVYDDYAHAKSLYATTAFDNETEQHRANVFGARLAYLFN